MNLQKMFDMVNKKQSFFRDDDEVWDAISAAGRTLYLEILKETTQRGMAGSGGGLFFMVTDATSLTLQANMAEYALPAQVDTLIRIRERLLATDPWRRIDNTDINSNDLLDAQFASNIGADQTGPVSDFVYTGPYELMADAEKTGDSQLVEHIQIGPIPQDNRFVELVYISQFVEITGPQSFNIIPPNGHDLQVAMAVARCLGAEDDDNEYFAMEIESLRPLFFDWVRKRQAQTARTVEPYLEDLD